MNRKALKSLLFFDYVVFEQHILIISPWTYIWWLKSRVNFALELEWAYIWVGPYSGF